MGQQQLLFLVLSTVIIGLATLAGIEAFQAGKAASEHRQIQQTALEVVQDVQVKAEKPKVFDSTRPSESGVVRDDWKVWALYGEYKTSPDILDAPGGGAHVEPSDGVECIIFTRAIEANSGGGVSFSSPHLVVTCTSEDFITSTNIGTDPDDLTTKSTTH